MAFTDDPSAPSPPSESAEARGVESGDAADATAASDPASNGVRQSPPAETPSPSNLPERLAEEGDDRSRSLRERLFDRVIRSHRLILVVTLAIVAVSAPVAFMTEMDSSIEPMFDPSDPALRAFRESRAIFGGDEFVLVAYDVANEDALLDRNHLDELKAFSKKLGQVPGVQAESTQDLAHLLRPDEVASSLGGLYLRYLRVPTIQDKILEFSEGLLVSPDRKTTAVVLRLLPLEETDASREQTIAAIRGLAASHDPPAVVVGEPVQIQDTFEYVRQDGRLLGVSSSLLLMLVIAVLFRRLRWVLLPLGLVWAALALTRATMTLLDLRISMVSSVLTSLVTIIGIATTMHVTVNYRERRLERLSRPAALKATMLAVGPAVFWSCTTTAIGFLSLTSSSVVPVKDFGLMMALGVLYVLALSLVLLPAGMLIGKRPSDPVQGLVDIFLAFGLRRLAGHLERHGRWWLALSAVVLLVSGYGLTRLTIETDYTKNFRDDSPIVEALEFFEERMGGSGSWELLLPAAERYTPEEGEKLRQLRAELAAIRVPGAAAGEGEQSAGDSEAKLTKIITVADGVDMIPPIVRRRGLQGEMTELDLLSQFQPEFAPSLYQPADRTMRVMLRAKERQPSEAKLALVEEVTKTATALYPDARPTGLFILLANLVGSILRDQWVSFLIAGTGIWIAISLAYRSPLIGLIALVPNLLPIALVLGSIGWLEVPMNMGIAMIASVSMGLTVDSAIHYISAYRRHREAGESPWAAVTLVHSDAGRALIFSHVALVGGFSVLALSNFMPLVYFGMLVSAAMLVGLFGVLVVLPVLLVMADRDPTPAATDDASPAVATA